jgi:hypothetical protein
MVKAGWVGETYFCWFQIGCEPGNEQWELRRWIPAYHLWITLPAPTLSELQAEVSFRDLRNYWYSLKARTATECVLDFPEWLDSIHRSCEKLASVWLWKKGKEWNYHK